MSEHELIARLFRLIAELKTPDEQITKEAELVLQLAEQFIEHKATQTGVPY